jgi:hypothetical protein
MLAADGPGSTYELIQSKGWAVESPDCGHSTRHITETYDSSLGKNVFVFTLHRDLDDDRCKNADRQRIELRGNTGGLQHTQGSTSYWRWKFKLPSGFQVSPNFTHIMQLKAYGNGHGSGSPILIFSARHSNKFEVSHPGAGGVRKTAPLSDFINVWVEAFVQITHSNSGSVNAIVKRLDNGQTLISWSASNLDMWEDGAGQGSPKLGLYRSLNSTSYLRDESIRFADICVSEKSASECPSAI